MYQFFGQMRYQQAEDNFACAGYELFLRERVYDRWQVPADFSAIDRDIFIQNLWATLSRMPSHVKQVSFNLEPRHFVDEAYFEGIIYVNSHFDIPLTVELVERRTDDVTVEALVCFAKRYQANGLSVCIDDVGTGTNTLRLVDRLDPYVSEYKYAIQNVRRTRSTIHIAYEISIWQNRAAQNGKRFTLEGIETSFELTQAAARFNCDYYQGFYLAKPEILPAARAGECHPEVAQCKASEPARHVQ